MQNKILYIIPFIILSLVLFVLFHHIKNNGSKQESKTDTTYSTGKTEQTYKKGKDSVSTKTESFHNKDIVKHSPKGTTYTFVKTDSLYSLSINIKPETDSTLSLEYFLDIATKDLVRIDTIFLTRIDTLKVKQTIKERIEPPFYNTFLFGALTTAIVIILIIQLIP